MQQPRGNPAIKVGLRAGILLGAVALLVTALYDVGALPAFVQGVEFVILMVGFFVAGLLAARRDGRAQSGLLAGLIASVLPAVMIVGANVVMAVVAPSKFAATFGYHNVSNGQLVTAAMVQALLGLVVWAIVGIVAGGLGGLIGRGRARAASAA